MVVESLASDKAALILLLISIFFAAVGSLLIVLFMKPSSEYDEKYVWGLTLFLHVERYVKQPFASIAKACLWIALGTGVATAALIALI